MNVLTMEMSVHIDNQPFKVIILYKQRGQKHAVKFTAMRELGEIKGKPGLLSCNTIVRTSQWNATSCPSHCSGHLQDTDLK